MVAGINFDLRTATVEWFEQGETKGKEVEMAAIESLNPDVIIPRPGERYIQEPPPVTHLSPLNPLQRVSSTTPHIH